MHTEYSKRRRTAGLSSREREIIDHLIAAEKVTVSSAALTELGGISRTEANQTLSRLYRKGWLRRVKRGVYVVVPPGSIGPDPPVQDAWSLAMQLFSPCFISGWSAAEYWDLTEQIFNSVVVVTARAQRRAISTYAGVTFRTRSLGERRMFGTARKWFGSSQVEIADSHRTIIDILDIPELGGGGRHTLDIVGAYWRSGRADPERLLEYARRFERGTVFKRLGYTAERAGVVDADWLEHCRVGISRGISKLDPRGPDQGRILTRWNLKVNFPVDES